MNKNVLNTDLTGKVAVVTGAGGVLCSMFAEALAASTEPWMVEHVYKKLVEKCENRT